ncbi:repressor protein C [Aurantimonas aggregata]|uniref:Repressor protein C n=1 Tax=Aurantimonas aggregata TaxID=2047720 RepID=A0A6L9MJD1_9HYPH|nr:S24 family peptidase [Aurantimonas aggregata]NDV87994.1 repressor protein C [Aurantimonas aggregata]
MEYPLKANVEQRLRELGRTPAEATRRGGLERTFIHDILSGRKKSVRGPNVERLARGLDATLEWVWSAQNEPGDETRLHPAPAPIPNASFPPRYERFPQGETVPLLGQSVTGPNGRFVLNGSEVGRLFRPPNLLGVEGAYAVKVYGTSMEPRFKAGEAVWINPHEPVRAGDDVVVQIFEEASDEAPHTYIKEFVSQSSKMLRLKQHNPDDGETEDLTFETSRVFSVHKIVFHAPV